MIRTAATQDAKLAVPPWGGDASSVTHLGDRGNSVFSFRNAEGQLQILRLTDPDFRSFDELRAELEFVAHLFRTGVGVAAPVPTTSSQLAIQVPCTSGPMVASSIAYAPGIEVADGSPDWNAAFFREWGRNLAQIHEGSVCFSPSGPSPTGKRWQWNQELLIAKAEELIPRDDKISLREFHDVVGECQKLPKNNSEFGLIHADHAPQNFRYDPVQKRITAFDFGNCCYHWFASDIAIALSTVRRKPNREEIRAKLLEGYSAVRSLPKNLDRQIELFIRLRVVYVYLSRLHLWSEYRTPEQAKELAIFKERVHAKAGWNSA